MLRLARERERAERGIAVKERPVQTCLREMRECIGNIMGYCVRPVHRERSVARVHAACRSSWAPTGQWLGAVPGEL